MKAQVFPLLLAVGQHANSRLGVIQAGRLQEFSAWLRDRAARLRAEKGGGSCPR